MSAEADSVCGAAYGTASPDRVNRRNGYRTREFDTRAGTLDLAVPKLRQSTYFREWLLERRKRAEHSARSGPHDRMRCWPVRLPLCGVTPQWSEQRPVRTSLTESGSRHGARPVPGRT